MIGLKLGRIAETERGSRTATITAACAGATVLALLAITAIASRRPLNGVGQVAPLGGRGTPVGAPPWSLVLVAVGAIISLAGLLATGLPILRRRRKQERTFRIPWFARVLALVIAMSLGAALIVAAIEGSRTREARSRGAPPPGAHRSLRLGHSSSFVAPGWLVPVVLAVVMGGSGAILLTVRLRRTADDSPAQPGLAQATAVQNAVEASLEDLRNEPDPRRAVIAAYRRMEATLGAAGLPRQAWEAPREYSGRAHTLLELSSRPLETLTALYERARFGVGEVGEPLRERAIAALRALREELQP